MPEPTLIQSRPLEAPLFDHVVKGTFIERPNRFVVRCLVDGHPREAYLPNPGRLWELLLPGRTLYLVRKERADKARLLYMAVAVERDGRPVMLHTHLANTLVARLLAARKIPGWEDAAVKKAEISAGRSRFDFLLEREGRPFFLEVKSCTLFGKRIAMFPDAVTERGKRHLEELAALARQGTPAGVIFLVNSPQVRFFLPDFHTDPEFASTFRGVRDLLDIKAISLEWRSDLSLSPRIREVAIPWDILDREGQDRGSYLLLLHLGADLQATVGSLGVLDFPKGYYLYVGAARRNLSKRMARHLRKQKNLFWHIDYLRPYADRCTALAVRSGDLLEHDLAEAVLKIADGLMPAFGSSDCACPSHLFHFTENPIHTPAFIGLLQYHRIDRLEKFLDSHHEK